MLSELQILDAELLGAFVTFSETLNFTHAARQLHLSQPALFERIRRLSQILETPLYERSGRALRLTEQGQRVAAFARESLRRTDGFLRELRGQAAQKAVTLAAGEGAFLYALGPALSRYARGGGALNLLTLGATSAAEAVRTGQADLAFTILDVPPPGLLAEEILRVPMCAAIPARHPLARRTKIRLEDLEGARLILPPTGRLYRDLVARFAAKGGADLEPPLEADGWPLMMAFVKAGLGVAIVNGSCAPPAGVRLFPVKELGTVAYRLLWRKGAELSEGAGALRDAIRGEAS